MARKHRSRKHRTRRRTRGAGYGIMPGNMIVPGIASVMKYTGIGVDTPAMPTRPLHQGLPGLSGGSRFKRNKRTRGGVNYGFPKSVDMLSSIPFETSGCRGAPAMRGGNSPLSYAPATAGYSTAAESVPGSAGFLRTVAYPDRVVSPSCGMKGGKRRSHKRSTRKHRTRKH